MDFVFEMDEDHAGGSTDGASAPPHHPFAPPVDGAAAGVDTNGAGSDDDEDDDDDMMEDGEKVDVGTTDDVAEGGGDADEDDMAGEIEKYEIGDVDNTGGGERVGCSDFELLRLVGKGSFAKVFQVRRISTGKIYAMKVLRKATIVRKKKGPQHARTERTILQEVNHPFIVNLRYAFQTHGKLYLIMDFLNGGELFYHLRRSHMFSEARARFYACEILLAIEHLHSLGIVYRDLKPENLCLDHEGHVVLTDFGLAKEAVFNDHDAMSFCGTAEYMSPEILLRGGHGQSSDWWSFGVLLFEMLTGNPPFVGSNRTSTYSKVLKGKLNLPSYLTPDARGLLKRLLQRSVSKRLKTADEVRAQPFFAGVNWDDVRSRRVPPLFVPDVSNEHDISNFDKSFTDATPTDSPAEPVEPLHDDLFQGFSYVAPSLKEHMRRLSTSGRGLSPLNPNVGHGGAGGARGNFQQGHHINTLHPGHQPYLNQPMTDPAGMPMGGAGGAGAAGGLQQMNIPQQQMQQQQQMREHLHQQQMLQQHQLQMQQQQQQQQQQGHHSDQTGATGHF